MLLNQARPEEILNQVQNDRSGFSMTKRLSTAFCSFTEKEMLIIL